MGDPVKLRPVEEADLSNLVRLFWDAEASGEYQWFGFRMADVREVEQRWREDGLIGNERSFLAVELEDGTCPGGSFGARRATSTTTRSVSPYFLSIEAAGSAPRHSDSS